MNDDAQSFPLIGSIQNSVGMGFLGNQAAFAIANALGARVIYAQTQYANAHGGYSGRTTTTADPAQFRRDVNFLIGQRPAIIHIGFLPKPAHVDMLAIALSEYKGVVLLDPVIGDHKKGLFVSEETARAIAEQLVPLAQIITPNRFEAEVLLGTGDASMSELAYLNGLFDLGPEAVIVKSFEREPEKHRSKTLFTNGYTYHRIWGPYFPVYPAHGAGDIFASSLASFIAIGGSPFAATLLSTALASRAVANTTGYGGASADPVAALSKWNPLGYQVEDDRAMRFAEKSNVECEQIKPTSQDGARLKFAPPKHKIMYG
ncbi:MAG TPA: bifunctional hydroxymethylpyrimidine kinase/phosphomethylpyrimidine kinase [Candidatus Baltobacteraceae bacterium]|nr:bifunctional hydroxymethylpyrimidine kinase/phosphomethylpyrimidine kinase [Candidatus Baltobacteraceae bacterium]